MSAPSGPESPAGAGTSGEPGDDCWVAAGADSSNRPWETDSLRIETGPVPSVVFGILAVCAAAALSLADMTLLYSPAGGYASRGFEYLADISHWRLLVGHYLGILALPLYIPGYWLVYRGLQPAGTWLSLSVFLMGSYAAAIGGAFHGAMAFIALIVQRRAGAQPEAADRLLELARAFMEPLQALVAGLFLLVSIGFALAVASGRTRFPRWLAFANPFVLGLVFVVPYLVAPSFKPALLALPAAFNLAHLFFFLLVIRHRAG